MSRIRSLQKRKSNPNLVTLIDVLLSESAKNQAPIWRDVAERLAKPRRLWAEVNVSKIEKYAKPEEYVVVPGKVLGSGDITKPVKVAAVSFSQKAVNKIEKAGGRCLKIDELVKINPKGSGVRLMA